MNPRSDFARVSDIRNSIRRIEEIKISLRTFENLEELNPIFHDAILYNLVVLGEAVANLSESARNKYHFKDWNEVVGLRNKLVHHYSGINEQLIKEIIEDQLLDLSQAIGD